MDEEVIRFIKTPKPGNIVKVYNTNGIAFGRVVAIEIAHADYRAAVSQREIVVLKPMRGYYTLAQCDFFFLHTRIKFI